MKMRLEWVIVPCVASMFAGNAISLQAQENPKATRNLNVVVTSTGDEFDAKSIQEKVAKELEKSGVSDDLTKKILKEIEATLSKVDKDGSSKSLKATVKNGANATVIVQGDDKNADGKKVIGQLFTTQLFRDPKGESYRIGVQCVQSDGEEGSKANDDKLGLEVKAVSDDSPAQKAGIQEGDVLVAINAKKISKISDLTNALQEAGKKEAEVVIEVQRDDQTIVKKVKPTKMKSADIQLEDIKLSLPTGGYVLDEEGMKAFEEKMKGLNREIFKQGKAQVFSSKDSSDELKKDMDDLKSELAEMKKLIRELAKSVNEKK